MILVLSLAVLYRWAKTQEQHCRLRITLIDSQTQKPIAGVIRCLTQSGNQAVPIGGALARGQGLDGKDAIPDWYVITESAEILLPRQPLKLEAFGGVETELASVSMDLSGRDQEALTIPLRSFSQMSQQGWYSGNTHLHLSNLNKDQAE